MTTREKLIQYTGQAIQSKGFYGTGIREILVATGIPKGSLYHHFPTGKVGLVSETLIAMGDGVAAEMKQCLKKKKPKPGLESIIEIMAKRLVDSEFLGGDPLTVCALELGAEHPDLVRICAQQYQNWLLIIQKFLTKRKVIGAEEKARLFFMQLQGALMSAKILRHMAPLELLSHQVKTLLN